MQQVQVQKELKTLMQEQNEIKVGKTGIQDLKQTLLYKCPPQTEQARLIQ